MSYAARSFSRTETMDLACTPCSSAESDVKAGSLILRQIEVLDRLGFSSARNAAQDDCATQSSMAFRLALDRAMSAGKPPMDSAHFKPSRASSTHSMEGVLMVSPWKIPPINLPLFAI